MARRLGFFSGGDLFLGKNKNPKPAFFGFENIKSLLVLVLIIFAIRWTVASPYHVPTPSMEPTIKVGDRLLAFKLAYDLKLPFTDIAVFKRGDPQRGDIVVFRYPADPGIDYVKRVVAIGGDRINLRDGYIFINGEKRPRHDHNFDRRVLDDIYDNKEDKLLFREGEAGNEHWVMFNRAPRYSMDRHDNWPLGSDYYEVPANSVFVMGDNRHNSTDSREWREVPLSYVKGKALIVLWSIHTPADGSWYEFSFRFRRFGTLLH